MRRLSNTFKGALGISGDSSDGGVSEAANPAAAESPPMNTSTATPHETPAQLRTSSSSPSSVSATATSSSSADTAGQNANGAASAEANKLPPNWEEVEHPDRSEEAANRMHGSRSMEDEINDDADYTPALSPEELDAIASAQERGTHNADGFVNGQRTQQAPIYSPPLAPPTPQPIYNEVDEDVNAAAPSALPPAPQPHLDADGYVVDASVNRPQEYAIAVPSTSEYADYSASSELPSSMMYDASSNV